MSGEQIVNINKGRITVRRYFWLALAIAFLALPALELGAQPPPPPQPTQPPGAPGSPPPPGFGDALAGLTGPQQGAWKDGQNLFTAKLNPGNGLGPIFNRDSCVACHSGPAIGGSSEINTTRFGKTTAGVFDPLIALGGSLLQERALQPFGVEVIPSQANTTAKRNTQPLFGLGLIEAIPDATILANVRSKPVNGVLGRAAMVTDPVTGKTFVGRFGWKAQQPNLLAFSADAFVNEMGITNRIYPVENAPNGNETLLAAMEPPNVPTPNDQTDPRSGKAGIDRLTDFMRFTAPPPAQPANASTTFGATFFLQIGCTSCHVPSMKTGANSVAALNSQTVSLYSDLLLHDMGALGDGIAQGNAGPREMRTAPLWGLSASGPYLHDGRAHTVDAAIRAHAGEAAYSVNQYLKLTSSQQSLLLQFLNSL